MSNQHLQDFILGIFGPGSFEVGMSENKLIDLTASIKRETYEAGLIIVGEEDLSEDTYYTKVVTPVLQLELSISDHFYIKPLNQHNEI